MTTHHAATENAAANDFEGPRHLLADHHRELEAVYRAILAATYADDARDLVFAYRAFEEGVLEHLEAEEREILPAYGRAAPDDAEVISMSEYQQSMMAGRDEFTPVGESIDPN